MKSRNTLSSTTYVHSISLIFVFVFIALLGQSTVPPVQADPPYKTYLPAIYKPPCPPVFADTFSDTATGWPIGDSASSTVGYLNGEYQILVKPSNKLTYVWDDFGASDYRVEVDVRPAAHLDGAVGLILSKTETGLYEFDINDGWFSLWRNDAGSWTPLVNWTNSSAINPGSQTNHLKAVRSGASITLYANDQMLTSINDATYTGMGLGMASEAWSANFDVRFDNFTVYTGTCVNPSAAALSPDHKASIAAGPIKR